MGNRNGNKESDREAIKHEGMFQGGDTTVTLTLDDGKQMECVVLTIFTAGPGDREYIAIMPENSPENEGTVYLYRYAETEEGDPDLTNIEDDDEYEIVCDAFDEILDEQEFRELHGEDPE